MKNDAKIDHAEWIGAATPEDVYLRVAQWTGGLTDRQHLVRSIVLDLDAHLEHRLHQILFSQLSRMVLGTDDKYRQQLHKRVRSMSFHQASGLLKPAFDVFDESIASDLQEIHALRCGPAHGDMSSLTYRKRDLVADHQALAGLYVQWWTLDKNLDNFAERTIDDSKEFERIGREVYFGKSDQSKNKL